MEKIKMIELFAGYGSQSLAMKRLQRDYPELNWEAVAFAEIDANAIKAYQALHGDNIPNLGDVSLIDYDNCKIKECNLLIYSFPCQAISQAGQRKGLIEGSGTTSSLLWECRKAIKHFMPKYLLMENVAALLADSNKSQFQKWCKELESYGYTNYYQILNARDYGVPQNRKRVFMVSVRDSEKHFYFPKPFKLEKRLKDVLEQNVDERLYLSDKAVRYILANSNFKPQINPRIGATITCGNHSYRRIDNFIAEPCIAALRGRSDGDWHDSEHRQKLEFKDDGTSNTITSVDKDNMVIEPAIIEDFYKEREPRIYNETAPTIRSEREGLKVVEPVVVGNIYPNNYDSAAGRVYDANGISPTLTTMQGGSSEPKIIEPVMVSRPHGYFNGNIYDDISPTVKSSSFNENNHIIEPAVLGWVRDEKGNVVSRPEVNIANCVTAGKRENTQNYVVERAMDAIRQQYPNRGILIYKGVPCFVRRLSTRELFRLMDVDDADIDILLNSGIAKTQLAKLAGNSIVLACLYHIFYKLFIDSNASENEQLSLF